MTLGRAYNAMQVPQPAATRHKLEQYNHVRWQTLSRGSWPGSYRLEGLGGFTRASRDDS